MPRSRSRSRSYSRSLSRSHRDKKYTRSHKSSRYKSRKSSREDRHKSSRRSKHYRSDRSRRHSSSRSRSSSRHSSSSSDSTTSERSQKSPRKEVKEVPEVEKVASFASVEQLGSNISAKVFQELNEDTFAAKSFTSTGKPASSSILIDITSNPKVQLKSTLAENTPSEDTVFHQNVLPEETFPLLDTFFNADLLPFFQLYGNDAARMEKWVKKLFAFRQRLSGTM